MLYAVVGPSYPMWNRLVPNYVTTTEKLGRAMITVAQQGAPKLLLENKDINRICDLS